MSDTESDWEGEDELGERPYGGRPYGGRPYGGRPYGGRPYGGKPYGGRPTAVGRMAASRMGAGPTVGGHTAGKPYGGKPYGGRPYGGRSGRLDLDEWSADIGDLVCDRSALLQLGATVVPAEDQFWVPGAGLRSGSGPVAAPQPVGGVELDPVRRTRSTRSVAMPSDSVARHRRRCRTSPGPLKADLAEALASAADAAMVRGPSPHWPGSVSQAADRWYRGRRFGDAASDARRGSRGRTRLRNPGWILHPQTRRSLSRGFAPGRVGRHAGCSGRAGAGGIGSVQARLGSSRGCCSGCRS